MKMPNFNVILDYNMIPLDVYKRQVLPRTCIGLKRFQPVFYHYIAIYGDRQKEN